MMKLSTFRISLFCLVTACLACSLSAVNIDIRKSTPVGSWQTREVVNVDRRGKQTLQVVKTALVGEEKRSGTEYVWIEASMQNYKMKNEKKHKAQGEPVIIKILMEKKMMSGNPEDVMNNMRGMGKEIIMQQGNEDPMLIEEGGMMGNAMLKSMGTEIDYNFNESGSEKISVPAGSFNCKVLEGTGKMEMKVLFKSMKMQSETKQWMSEDVPFGVVKMETTSIVNGDETKSSAQLIDYGRSGAVSQITKTPKKMNIPGLDGMFGN